MIGDFRLWLGRDSCARVAAVVVSILGPTPSCTRRKAAGHGTSILERAARGDWSEEACSDSSLMLASGRRTVRDRTGRSGRGRYGDLFQRLNWYLGRHGHLLPRWPVDNGVELQLLKLWVPRQLHCRREQLQPVSY